MISEELNLCKYVDVLWLLMQYEWNEIAACEYFRLYDPHGKFTLPKFPSILTIRMLHSFIYHLICPKCCCFFCKSWKKWSREALYTRQQFTWTISPLNLDNCCCVKLTFFFIHSNLVWAQAFLYMCVINTVLFLNICVRFESRYAQIRVKLNNRKT